MIFTLKDLKGNILFTGTRQEYKHFMKCRKFSRADVVIERLNDKPAVHYTIPIVEEIPLPKSWIRRTFFNE